MKRNRLGLAAAWLAVWTLTTAQGAGLPGRGGASTPQTSSLAEKSAQSQGRQKPMAPAIQCDVALGEGNTLLGQLVDRQNFALGGEVVSVMQQGRLVAQTHTDANGVFAARLPRGGVYVVATRKAGQVVRTWTPRTAPPASQRGVLLVEQNEIALGQCCGECDQGNCGCEEACCDCCDEGGGFFRRNIIPLAVIGGFAGWIIAEASSGGDAPAGS